MFKMNWIFAAGIHYISLSLYPSTLFVRRKRHGFLCLQQVTRFIKSQVQAEKGSIKNDITHQEGGGVSRRCDKAVRWVGGYTKM